MPKRPSENGQMRREEYEQNEANEASSSMDQDSGEMGFERAPEELIRKRKIVKARLGGLRKSAATSSPSTSGSGANPFSGFQGLTAASTTTQPASSNPFAGFSGLTSTSSSSSSPLMSKNQQKSSPVLAKLPSTYPEAMATLNKEFFQFINSQREENPASSWVVAVQEYLQYAEQIAKKFPKSTPVPFSLGSSSSKGAFGASSTSSSSNKPDEDKNKQSSTTTATATSTFGSFGASSSSTSSGSLFGANKPAATDSSSSASKPSGGFSFKLPNKDSNTADKPAAATGGFSFKLPTTSTTSSTNGSSNTSFAPSGGFTFGSSTTTSTFGSSSSFGSSKPLTSSTSSSAKPSAEPEEEEEQIGREEATVILKSDDGDDECVFEVEKTKVFEFKKDEKRWADKGVHPFKLLVSKKNKTARILIRNQIGKIVLNASLYKGLKVQPHEAKGKKCGVILSLQVESSMTQFLLKVNPDHVSGMIKALEEHTPK